MQAASGEVGAVASVVVVGAKVVSARSGLYSKLARSPLLVSMRCMLLSQLGYQLVPSLFALPVELMLVTRRCSKLAWPQMVACEKRYENGRW